MSSTGHATGHATTTPYNPPYTQAELQFLKKHWKGEFGFLRAYGMSWYKEEDRAEGRIRCRQMMGTHDDQ